MKNYLRFAAPLALLSLTTQPFNLPAAEVSLSEVTLAEDGSTTAVVERQQGPYVGAWLGGATGGRATAGGSVQGAAVENGNGFAGGLKLGYFYRTPFFIRPAIELEFSYLNSDFGLSGNVGNPKGERANFSGHGDFQALASTVNLILALDLGAIRDQVGDFVAGLHPYVGAGAGLAYSSLETFEGRVKGQEGRKDGKLRVDGGSKIDFAYQLMAGLEVDLDEDFSVFGEYKHMSLDSAGSSAVGDYQTNLWVVGCKLAY